MSEETFTLQEVREAERAAYIQGKSHGMGCGSCQREARALYPDVSREDSETGVKAESV